MMASPDSVPSEIRDEVAKCPACQQDRRPRMFICDYHAGFVDGWEAARSEVPDA